MNEILFAPAHLFKQMEHSRDYSSVVEVIEKWLPSTVIVDEIGCRIGGVGKALLNSGRQWRGWDSDPDMLEKTMLHCGFERVGMGGWSQLPPQKSELILGCFDVLARIPQSDLPLFFNTLTEALIPSGRLVLQHCQPVQEQYLHRSFNGRSEKWVAMCVPRPHEEYIDFAWHFLGAKTGGQTEEFVVEVRRYLHSIKMLSSIAAEVGLSSTLESGWWLMDKD